MHRQRHWVTLNNALCTGAKRKLIFVFMAMRYGTTVFNQCQSFLHKVTRAHCIKSNYLCNTMDAIVCVKVIHGLRWETSDAHCTSDAQIVNAERLLLPLWLISFPFLLYSVFARNKNGNCKKCSVRCGYLLSSHSIYFPKFIEQCAARLNAQVITKPKV